jgi:hypothetical protein
MTKYDEIKGILGQNTKFPTTTEPFDDAYALGAYTLVNATNGLFRKS